MSNYAEHERLKDEWLLSDFNQEFIDRAREFKFYFEGKK